MLQVTKLIKTSVEKSACQKKTERIYNDYIVHVTSDRLKSLSMARLLTYSIKRKTYKCDSLDGKFIIVSEIPLRLACLKTGKLGRYFE